MNPVGGLLMCYLFVLPRAFPLKISGAVSKIEDVMEDSELYWVKWNSMPE